jgi:uncharacterized protein YbjT (DUF2867 family)
VNVLVTGGAGVLGRDVVKELRARGHRARVLSRQPGTGDDWAQGDIASGEGLDRALSGMDAVIHAATAARQPLTIRSTDVEGTRKLLEAAARAHIAHVVYVSIVGMEGVAYPYYRQKLAAERIVRADTVPWSILRATQFHTLMDFFLSIFARPPLYATVPFDWKFQPVDTRDVAVRLVEVVTAKPGGMLPDFGGPEVRRFKSLADSWVEARRIGKRLVNLPLPFKFSRQFAQGRLLTPEHKDGTITFEQYLARKYGQW